MDIRFDNKVAVVTGGGSGIGFACAKALLDSGAAVALVGSRAERLEAAAEALGGPVSTYVLDLGDAGAIAPAVCRIVADLGGIDCLVQSAGILAGGPSLDITPETWDQVMAVNSRGLFFMMQEVVRQAMIPQGSGAVVNIASMAGIRGMTPPMSAAHYSASKGAVVALSMQAAVEWAEYGIRVNAVAPGGVRVGPMRDAAPPRDVVDPVPLKRLSEPEEVAATVCFFLSDQAAMVTGGTTVIDGGQRCRPVGRLGQMQAFGPTGRLVTGGKFAKGVAQTAPR